MRQPGQTLTSSVAPAFITCLRWRGFTSECACEGAARHDLLRRHRGSSSTCPAPTIPPPVCRLLSHHQAIQLQWPDSSSSTLDTPRSNSTMLSDRPRCPRSPSDAGAQRHSTCRPPAVRCATTRRVAIRPLPQRYPPLLTMRRPYRAMPHALPSAAQVGRAVSAVEEEGGSLRAGPATSCFLHCVWETGIVLRGIWEAFAPLVDL